MSTHRAAAAMAAAIRIAVVEERFHAADVRRAVDDPTIESTISRILRQLEDDDWLQRTSDQSSIWRAGTYVRVYSDMRDSVVEKARTPISEPGGAPSDDEMDFFP